MQLLLGSPSLECLPGKMKWQTGVVAAEAPGWEERLLLTAEANPLELLSQLVDCSLIRTWLNPGSEEGPQRAAHDQTIF